MNHEELIKLISTTVAETLNNAPQWKNSVTQDHAKIEHPGTYDGKASDLNTWILKMKNYLTMCNTPEDIWASHGYASLKGLAHEYFTRMLRELPEGRSINCITWSDFVAILKQQFDDPYSNDHHLDKLVNLKMKTNLEGYIQEFQETATRIGECPESILVNFFTRGLNAECAKYARLQKPNTVFEAIHIARTFTSITDKTQEITTQRYNPNRHSQFNRPFYPAQPANRFIPMEIDAFQYQKNQRVANQERQWNRRKIQCFKCQNQGHIARNCPLNNRQPNRNARPQINNMEYQYYPEEMVMNNQVPLLTNVLNDNHNGPNESNAQQGFTQSH